MERKWLSVWSGQKLDTSFPLKETSADKEEEEEGAHHAPPGINDVWAPLTC